MSQETHATLGDGRRRYMTVKEVAEHLGIGRTSAYDLIANGDLKAKRFGKSNVRVHVDDLARYRATWRDGFRGESSSRFWAAMEKPRSACSAVETRK